MATSIDDLEATYRAIAGDDPNDPWSVSKPVPTSSSPIEATGLRIGLPHPWLDRPLAPEIASGFRLEMTGSIHEEHAPS